MSIAALGLAIFLVGIPTCAGAYFIVCYFGNEKASNGVAGLLLGIGVSCVLIFFFPQGRLSQADYSLVIPWILGLSFLFGAVSGLVSRNRQKGPDQDAGVE